MIHTNTLSNILLLILLILLTETNCSNLLKDTSNKNHKNKIEFKLIENGLTKHSSKRLNLYSHLFFVLAEKCSEKNCSSRYGKCVNGNVCKCRKGYANAPKFSLNKDQYCQYEQKKQKYAFFLELISFCGIGHLYSHRIIMFFLKFLLFAITLIFMISCMFNSSTKHSISNLLFKIASYSILLLFLCYHILDLMMLYLNKYTDGYGIPLTLK